MTEYKLGEMFSGPGGIALGALTASRAHAGASTIQHGWAVDYDPDTTATYARNIAHGNGQSTVHTADVRDFDLRQVEPINAFAFGFPCNDFSLVGERRGLDGDFGPLYSYGVHTIALNAPDWFIAENVSGLRGANGGKAFGRILSALKNPGSAALDDPLFTERYADQVAEVDSNLEYRITAHLYRFEEYGVPQRRHRVLVAGIRNDIAQSLPRPFLVPIPTSLAPRAQMTARDVLETDPIRDGTANHEPTRHPQHVKDRLSQIQPGRNAFNTNFDEKSGLKLNVKGATLSNIYRRLAPDSPAYTVTGSGGGGTHMYHWNEPRALTNRERARLQTFPDDFVFIGGRQSVRKQVGMAVPPKGAEVVFQALLRTLDGVEYRHDHRGPNINAEELIQGYRNDLSAAQLNQALPPEDPQASMPGIG